MWSNAQPFPAMHFSNTGRTTLTARFLDIPQDIKSVVLAASLRVWPFGFSTSLKMILSACAALTQSAVQIAAAAADRMVRWVDMLAPFRDVHVSRRRMGARRLGAPCPAD